MHQCMCYNLFLFFLVQYCLIVALKLSSWFPMGPGKRRCKYCTRCDSWKHWAVATCCVRPCCVFFWFLINARTAHSTRVASLSIVTVPILIDLTATAADVPGFLAMLGPNPLLRELHAAPNFSLPAVLDKAQRSKSAVPGMK